MNTLVRDQHGSKHCDLTKKDLVLTQNLCALKLLTYLGHVFVGHTRTGCELKLFLFLNKNPNKASLPAGAASARCNCALWVCILM